MTDDRPPRDLEALIARIRKVCPPHLTVPPWTVEAHNGAPLEIGGEPWVFVLAQGAKPTTGKTVIVAACGPASHPASWDDARLIRAARELMPEAAEALDEARRAAWSAFVEGARWWQYHSNGSTMFPSERDEAMVEAVKRYPYIPHLVVEVLRSDLDEVKATLALRDEAIRHLRGELDRERGKPTSDEHRRWVALMYGTPEGTTPMPVYLHKGEVVVCGTPTQEQDDAEEAAHNCDAMGCSSVSHVLWRGPLADFERLCAQRTEEAASPAVAREDERR